MNSQVVFTTKALESMKKHGLSLMEILWTCASGKIVNNIIPNTSLKTVQVKDKSISVLYTFNDDLQAIIIGCWIQPRYLN